MREGASSDDAPAGGRARQTKGQERLERILAAIPATREQLLAALDDLAPDFTAAAIQSAAQAPDPRERNKVAVIEHELDVLIGHLEELASRALAEGQRLGAAPKGSGSPWQRLAELGVISNAGATRLQNVKDMRNELAHAYPPASWRALHRAVETLLAELDRYKVRVSDWLEESGILPK